MEKEVLVYVELQGTPHLVGRLWARMRKDRETATFEYDKSWLAHPPASVPHSRTPAREDPALLPFGSHAFGIPACPDTRRNPRPARSSAPGETGLQPRPLYRGDTPDPWVRSSPTGLAPPPKAEPRLRPPPFPGTKPTPLASTPLTRGIPAPQPRPRLPPARLG